MPYTRTSLLLLLVVTLTLCGLAGSGVVAGPWLFLVIALALAAPALILRDPVGAPALARHHGPPRR